MTLEEIKQRAKDYLHPKETWMKMESVKEDFFLFKGIERIQLETKGNVIDIVTIVVSGYGERDKMPVKTVKMDSLTAEDLVKLLSDYSDTLSAAEREWNELLREVKTADMSNQLGKMGVESILKASLDGIDSIDYTVKDCESDGKKMVVAKVWARRREISVTVDPMDVQMPEIVQQMADSIKAMDQEESSDLKERVYNVVSDQNGRALAWYFDEKWPAEQEKKRQEKCNAVISAGMNMAFTTVSSTQQQLLDALKGAGVNAVLSDSCYSYGKKDIEITNGCFKLIITDGKIPGMLVACSPFFGVERNKTVNICVSHRPIEQVVAWVKEACQTVEPVASEIVGVAELIATRYGEYMQAKDSLLVVMDLPGVIGEVNSYGRPNCKLTINNLHHIEIDDMDVDRESPAKTVAAVMAMAKMLSATNV